MFSANENLVLRQHKKRVVEMVESCIPESALDMGTMVMVMQVSCKAPGCVPLETAIIIVFPKSSTELIPGLPESCGGNYKTKVLMPMAEVTQEDVYEALPPTFIGGLRSMEKLCIQARDVMLGQITQLFAEEDVQGRRLMSTYLQQCLTEYVQRGCVPPELGDAWGPLVAEDADKSDDKCAATSDDENKTTFTLTPTMGNFVFRRPVEDDQDPSPPNPHPPGTGIISPTTMAPVSAPASAVSQTCVTNATSKGTTTNSERVLAQLGERQHAPGIRQPGCPCCDPDNPNNFVEQMMTL